MCERFLGRGNDRPVFFNATRYIQQAKYHSARTHSNEVKVVASLPLAVIGRSQFSLAKLRNRGLYRLCGNLGRLFVVEEEAHGKVIGEVSTKGRP